MGTTTRTVTLLAIAAAMGLSACAGHDRLQDPQVRLADRPECQHADAAHVTARCRPEPNTVWSSEGRGGGSVDFRRGAGDD